MSCVGAYENPRYPDNAGLPVAHRAYDWAVSIALVAARFALGRATRFADRIGGTCCAVSDSARERHDPVGDAVKRSSQAFARFVERPIGPGRVRRSRVGSRSNSSAAGFQGYGVALAGKARLGNEDSSVPCYAVLPAYGTLPWNMSHREGQPRPCNMRFASERSLDAVCFLMRSRLHVVTYSHGLRTIQRLSSDVRSVECR